ncbi:glycerophosphodiester phosphodiesterase [Actinomyces sp. MRS3W]|uniref:glycerophosphodiester phosphodiesterase n=1 Tax=Actinomyces sp. MRS3W TaxID=2800796 RepID=UPI0028FD3083|nr:glycerophosphodiester phosphodiesterase [Actinomyces sp. MRS3W]MDU0349693.1 glycerophosphodiester phosphodiesterase [Actinomyces sp. MRS3W]
MTPTRRCAVVAHRGGGGEAPENTWSAVEHVAALGLSWMETDLRSTADGVVVLSHDADLTSRAGDPRRIVELTWEELAGLDAGDGRPFVRLDEVLAAHPGIRFNIDLKDSAVVQPALQVVREADALGRVRFASFSARRLAVLRRQEPRATTSLGVSDVAGLMLLSEAAVPVPHTRWSWANGRVDAAQVPLDFHGVPVVTPRFIAQAHGAGLEVHVWTVDDPAQMRRLAAMHVDAIITDRPALALEALG